MLTGTRTTRQTISELRNVRRVDDGIAMLEPNIAPLITLLTRMGKKKPIDQTKREWLQDDYAARWDQNSATTVNSATGSTAITVLDGTKFVAGQLFVVPKVSTSTAIPEVIRVVTVSGNNLTVARAVGGVGLDTILPNAPLRIIGTAYEEGAAIGQMKSTVPTWEYNYTQIFRNVIDYTGTNSAVRVYGTGGSDRTREQKKMLLQHKIDINGALLWGVRSEDLTGGPTGKPLRTMGGINYYTVSNVTDANGMLTRKTFEAFSRQVFRFGSKTKLLLAAPLVCSAINAWGNSWLQVTPGETRIGVNVQTIQTAHGVFKLLNDWMLEDGVVGANGFGHCSFAIDTDELEYNYLSFGGENRDTHFRENVVQDGRDAYVDEYLSELSCKFGQEKYHGKLINVTDYME